jgi:polyhydroxyalkanoate synthesis regulator phasin
MRIPRQVPIAQLEQLAQGVKVEATTDPEVAARVDAAGTPDGVVTPAEVDAYRAALLEAGNQLVAAAGPKPTPQDEQRMAMLAAEMQRLSPLGYDVLERTSTADLWATLARRIDEVVQRRDTGQRLGDGNGEISADELRGYVEEMQRRIASPTKEDEVEQLQQLMQIAARLLEQLERA